MAEARRRSSRIAKPPDLGAPLYVAWQITNECNLACLHCIEESGPGKAFKDELTTETRPSRVIDQLIARARCPTSPSPAASPWCIPHFFEMVERITRRRRRP